MAKSHEGCQVPFAKMEDVPIDNRKSEKFMKSKLDYVKSSEKSGIPCLNMANNSNFFMRYKITVFTAIVSIVALLLFSASIIYMALQSTNNYSSLKIVSIVEKKPTTNDEIFKNEKNPNIFEPYRMTQRQLYYPETRIHLKKREIRKIQKRQIPETSELKNDDMMSVGNRRLRRIGTGSKIPREIKITPDTGHFYREIYKDYDEKRRINEKRAIERREKMSSCQRNYEHCKSIVESMQSLVKTTSDNVESLNQLIKQIKVREETDNTDPHRFEDFLQCIECKQMTDNDRIMFPNYPMEDDNARTIYDHPLYNNWNSQMRNMSAIVDLLNSANSNAGDVTENMFEVEEKNFANGENSMSPIDTKKVDPNVRKTVHVTESTRITDGIEIIQILKNTTIVKQHPRGDSQKEMSKIEIPAINNVKTEASTITSLNFGSLIPLHDRPTDQINVRNNVPMGPFSIYNSPELRDSSGWGETTGAQAMIEVSSDGDRMTPVRGKSFQDWRQEDAPMPFELEPRIMKGTNKQPTNGVYEGNSIILPTAENAQTSQQVQFTPSMWMPFPVCFFGSSPSGPPNGPFKQSMPGMTFPASQPGTGGFPYSGNQYPHRGFGFSSQPTGPGFGPMQFNQQQGNQFRPGQQFPYGNTGTGYQQVHRVGPTAPGIQNFWPNFGNMPTGPGQAPRGSYYCTYMPTPTFQYPSMPGVSEFQRSSNNPGEKVQGIESPNSNPELTWNMHYMNYPGYARECDRNSHVCDDGSICVSKNAWCDGTVDCLDASDEMKCSCRDRINKDRICDGYFDCPRGEDELGCFGCPTNSFSCQNWGANYRRTSCVPLLQRCDGLQQCPNGKDEMDCSILTQSYIENGDVYTVGYTTGYLHKNWQGQWYPVCTPTESWAIDACLAETGSSRRETPRIQTESTPPRGYQVSYLSQGRNGEIKVVPTCHDKAIYVRCPEIPCGTRVLSEQDNHLPYKQRYDPYSVSSKNSGTNETSNVVEKIVNEVKKYPRTVEKGFDNLKLFEAENRTNSEIVGVVGGRESQPKAWPFLVAIYKDGYFHCGGTIINEEWILTAAHCVDGFSRHYYEIQAGLLRRFSFSPMAQTRRVSYIKMHPNYESSILKNDLALMRLIEPLLFNRWIRPACLPKSHLTESYWRNGPYPDSTCVAIGWGAMGERGPDPDHLREVELPILRECQHPEDRNEASICAGYPQGGRDACQGDSGGPLMCNYPDSENQFYVAGIVSHGEGCARPNEPGAYTKVSHFVDWIEGIMDTREIIMIGPKPLGTCPGFSCGGGLGRCLPSSKRCDRIVNCLDAEDEINCGFHTDFPRFRENNTSNDDRQWNTFEEPIRRPNIPNDITTKNGISSKDEASSVTNYGGSPSEFLLNDNEMSTSVEQSTKSVISSTTLKDNINHNSMNVTSSQQTNITTIKPSLGETDEKFAIQRFICTRLIQSLPIDKRCNRVIDCEDGTDEDNCTCKDYLANLYPKAICNGHVDCDDGTDEENCAFCKDDEFVCSRSGTCVLLSRMCDRYIDCPNMEDELDCFILTNGNYVIKDLDKRPHMNLEGVAAQRKNGYWRPVCQNHSATIRTRLSNEFCQYFGFGAAESVEEIEVRDSPMEIRASTIDNVIPYEYPPSYESPEKGEKTCQGLYIRCKPVLSANTSHLIITNPKNQSMDYLWPWQASIFVNGRYHCPAILLEHSWLLATSRCVENLDLKGNYTTALLGMAPPYLYVDSPYQQIAAIDSIKISKKLDAALLHLDNPVNITRYVQPIFVQKRIFPATRKDVCIATGVDEKYNTKTTFLQPVLECPKCHRCYKNATFEECRNKTSNNWSGTIVCRGSGTWYPAAIFYEKDIPCGFQSVQTLTSIDYGNAHFTEIMDEDLNPIAGPNCDGVRCRLGNCIPWDKVCDGIDDCREGSDEAADYCDKRKELCETNDGIGCKCSKTELRCASGQCVPKKAFCDYKIDCNDRSDETPQCTCADYLKLTAPERLCNNVRDCLDKSDESSEHCPCKDASFKCPSVNGTYTCVSQDFVCDGERDCPNGEDEQTCRIVKGTLKDPPGTGQVLRRSFGVWHSECFPEPITSTHDVSELCRTMNYDFGNALTIDVDENRYGPALIPERDDFYMIRLNQRAWITTRKNRPLINLVIAQEPCHRAFVKCSKINVYKQ